MLEVTNKEKEVEAETKQLLAPCNNNKKVRQKVESYCHRSAVQYIYSHNCQCKQHKSHLRTSMWFFILQPWPQVPTIATLQHSNRLEIFTVAEQKKS